MFQIILDELEQLDSSNFCEFLPEIGIDNQDCHTEFDGILNLGSEQFMSSLLAHI